MQQDQDKPVESVQSESQPEPSGIPEPEKARQGAAPEPGASSVEPSQAEPKPEVGEGQPESAKPAKRKASARKKPALASVSVNAAAEDFAGGGGAQWYVIHTLSGQENKVKENLESRLQSEEVADLVSQVLIPTENVSEVKSGKKTVTTRKFFPGYVLVNMILNDKTWYFIRNTSGVIGFIGTGKPVPLQDHEVTEILSQIEEKKEKVKPKVMFDVGETVKVNDGPFVNFTGTVEEVNPDRGKLKVMVSIFGRATPIELEYWQVERS